MMRIDKKIAVFSIVISNETGLSEVGVKLSSKAGMFN